MSADELEERLLDELRRVGRRMGLMPLCPGISARTGIPSVPATLSVLKDTRWERTYQIGLQALPGGPSHIAFAIVAKPDMTGSHDIETMQVARMLHDHLDRMTRLECIVSAGHDPLRPPAWSIEVQTATLDVMRALGGEPERIGGFSEDMGCGLTASVPGLPDADARVSVRDSILEWQPAFATPRRWTYDASCREIRLAGCALPETTLTAIRQGGSRVCDIVSDDVLDLVTTEVKDVRNGQGCVFLSLREGWAWLANPPGETKGWRIAR